MNALKDKVLVGLRWTAGGRLLAQGVTWAITLFVIRLLRPEDYGLLAMADIFIAFLAMLNEFGLGGAVVQMKDMDALSMRRVFGFLILFNFGLFGLSIVTAPLIAAFFEEPRLALITRVLALQFLLVPVQVIPQSLLDRALRFKEHSIVDFVCLILGSLLTLILALMGWGVWSLVWGMLGLNLCKGIALNLVCPYLHRPSFSLRGIRNAIAFGGYLVVSRILWFFYSQADTFVVAKLLGKEALGFYAVAANLASLPMDKISGILNQVAFPAFSSLQGDKEQAAGHFTTAVRLLSLAAFPTLWGISSIAPEAVGLFLGPMWVNAVLPLQILSLVIPIRMLGGLMSPILSGLGRPDLHLRNVLTACLWVPLGFIVGSRWGILGVSLGWVAVFPWVFVLNLRRVAKVLEIRTRALLREMEAPFLAAMGMFLVVMGLRWALFASWALPVRMLLLVLGGGLAYAGILRLFAPQALKEALSLLRK